VACEACCAPGSLVAGRLLTVVLHYYYCVSSWVRRVLGGLSSRSSRSSRGVAGSALVGVASTNKGGNRTEVGRHCSAAHCSNENWSAQEERRREERVTEPSLRIRGAAGDSTADRRTADPCASVATLREAEAES